MTTLAKHGPPSAAGSLRPILAREHAAWLAEVSAALGPAQGIDAGPWMRWNALRYLQAKFPERVERERRLVQGVAARLSDAERAHLWALGELLEVLPAYLGHLIGLCHRAGEFTEVTARILTALDRWCRAVEGALGPLPVTALSREMREALGAGVAEPAVAGGVLAPQFV